ncbi:MAG: geranylgeranylglyceryl/heptaprenylglyceryl phosphate synthase [Bacteroidales bacterium]|nr:MAG: geranylgeranylglyceryl/heptaprenylglyceryl phosphate synthase [Bacteroidales bacterium]
MLDIYKNIVSSKNTRHIALLLDPDKQNMVNLEYVLDLANKSSVSFILVGGSLVNTDIDEFIRSIKLHTDLPLILFPGSALQFSSNADAILLLSLISGRNPEFLIGNHVQVAYRLKQSGIEIIPTGYLLIESGGSSSVQYMSNTLPIPSNKIEIAAATALAGEQLGLKMIYLEAGSGAKNHVPIELIRLVKKEISIPLIVGGGLKTVDQINAVFAAGANVVVLGNGIENNPELLKQI